MTDLTIQNLLTRNAKMRSEHIALVYKDASWSYAKLNREVNRSIRALQANGIKKGEKVATHLPNCIELIEIYWACAKMGAVAVPLSPLLRDQGLNQLVENSEAKIVINPEKLPWYLDQKSKQSDDEPDVERVTSDDPYNIIYSSGTTGNPKGIVISHGARALYGSTFANTFRITPESRPIHAGSMVFNGAFVNLMAAMYLGGTFILEDAFKPALFIERIKKEKATHMILVPSQIISCLQDPSFTRKDCPSIECILSMGAPLLQEQKNELNRRLPNVFYELYGLTEGFMTILDRADTLGPKSGSVGYPAPCMEMKIVNENGEEMLAGEIGEISGRGPMLMTEYYKNPKLTAETLRDGWLRTGDLGYVDKDGFLFLTGRKKDMIISGGVNVYPVDIEQVAINHPKIREVAVFGVPHKEWGETPVAAVVLKKSGNGCPDEMREWINSRLSARFQKVHRVWIVEDFPRNVAGKILKIELAEKFKNQV